MTFSVDDKGFNWGERAFVCDESGNVVAEVFGETLEEAKERAEIVATALNAAGIELN